MIKNIEEAEYLLSDKPLRSASAERILILNEIMGKNKELCQPKRFALMLRELLDRVSVPIEEYDIIAGRALDRELTEDEEAIFKSFIKSPDYPRRSAFLDSGHCTYSWQDVVELGLIGLKKRAEESLSKQTDTEKRDFLDGVIGVYSAIERYIERYEDTAKLKGMTALAETLRKARTEKPSDFVPKYVFNEPVNRERLRFLYAKNVPLVAYSCLAKGGYEVDERMPSEQITGARLDAIRALAAEKNVNTSAAVVAYLANLHRISGMPRVIPLFASSRVSHFLDNLRGVDISLSDSELELLYKA